MKAELSEEQGFYYIPKTADLSNECIELISKCLQYDNNNVRPWSEIMESSYLNENHNYN